MADSNYPSNTTNNSKRVRRNAVGTRDINNMRIEKVVGSGTFGVVYKAIDKVMIDSFLHGLLKYIVT